jgi:hypothetical protein
VAAVDLSKSEYPSVLAKLAYEANLRALDKQEALLEEVRSRTGLLLGASSLATSFLGQRAFQGSPSLAFSVIAVAAFVLSIASGVFILLPKDNLVFSLVGTAIYERLYEFREDPSELYRRLAYDMDRFWNSNDEKLQRLFTAYRAAAAALVVEILSLIALLSDSIF